MKSLGIKKAFILAGGEGTRLRPLTLELAKPLVPVCGKPVLQWNIECCKSIGAKEIVLALGYKAKQVMEYFKKNPIKGIKLHFNVEDKFLGTAGALKFAQAFFEKEKKFLMLNGDECKEIDFCALNETFEKNNAIAAIALTPVDYLQAGGIVKLDGEKIVGWDEHPKNEKDSGTKLINAGAYILSNKIFSHIPSGEITSIEKQTYPNIIKEGKLFGCNCVKQFFQTDTFERYEKAICNWKGFCSNPKK